MRTHLSTIYLTLILFTGLFLSGCLSGGNQECETDLNLDNINDTQLQTEIDSIDAYLNENDLQAQTDAETGIRFIINEEGDGATPSSCGFVEVTYTGSFLESGEVFDESEEPVALRLLNLIPAWQIILPDIPAGSTVTLYVPSAYAYGPSGAGNVIPPNATLIFNITLLGVS